MKEPIRKEFAEAVTKYEEKLWPRGNKSVIASEENINMLHDWESMLKSPLFVGGMAKNVAKI
jgi:hypothetical protein